MSRRYGQEETNGDDEYCRKARWTHIGIWSIGEIEASLGIGLVLIHADDLLRAGTGSQRHSEVTRRFGLLVALIVVFGAGYGVAMGSYGGEAGVGGARPLQMLYSAIKVPLLLLATFGLSLPSYFVINSLLGLREDVGVAVRALLATQACLTVVRSHHTHLVRKLPGL